MTKRFTHKTLAIIIAIFAFAQIAKSEGFNAINNEGVTIYYSITDATNFTVEVTHDGDYSDSDKAGYSGEVKIPETVNDGTNDYTVTSIGNYAFSTCNISSVEIPNTVKTIGKEAFFRCSLLNTVIINEGVETIGVGAFEDCQAITSINIPSSVKTISDSAFRGVFLTQLTLGSSVETIGSYAFQGNRISNLKMPNSVKTIGTDAFSDCLKLLNVEFSNNLTTIDDNAFKGCNKLTTLYLPNSLTTIGSTAFRECSNLELLILGSSVKSIGDNAFQDCNKLKSLVCPISEIPTLGGNAFYGMHQNESGDNVYNKDVVKIYVPNNALENYRKANEWKSYNLLSFDYTITLTDAGNVNSLIIPAITDEPIKLLPTPSKEGYAFSHWTIDNMIVDNETKWKFTSNKEAVAHWRIPLLMSQNTLTVCNELFYDNGGVENNYLDYTEYTLTLFPATEGTKLKIDFSSYHTEKKFDKLSIYNGASQDAPKLITLDDEHKNVSYTATNADGALTLVFSSDNGGNFSGWEASVKCSGIFYDVTFDSNGGEGTMQTQEFEMLEVKKLMPNTFAKTDHIFKGWSTNKNATEAEVFDEYLYTISEATILYAVWDEPTSIKDTQTEELNIYPNPATTHFSIGNIIAAKVQIYNLAGNLVQAIYNEQRINISELAAGVYIVNITDTNGKVYNKRLIVE